MRGVLSGGYVSGARGVGQVAKVMCHVAARGDGRPEIVPF